MVSVKFANKDCNVFNGSNKIEYGYNGGIFYSEYGNDPEIETPTGYVYEFNGLVDGKTELDLYGIENNSDIIAPVSTNITIPKTALFELIFVNG